MFFFNLSKISGVINTYKDGIGEISGLYSAQMGETVSAAGSMGIILNLNSQSASIAFFKVLESLGAGISVFGTGVLVSVLISPLLLGYVLNVVGKSVIESFFFKKFELVFFEAPLELKGTGILFRARVRETLFMGTLVLDALIPVGFGQRELIIGDRQTGKTSISLTAIAAQITPTIVYQ